MPIQTIKPLKPLTTTPLPGTSPAPTTQPKRVTPSTNTTTLLGTGALPSSGLHPAPSTATPPPVSSSSSPITPATPTVPERVQTDINTAKDLATDYIGDAHAATISNPYQQQTDDFLKLLKERLGGLNTEEMTAARDSGLLGLDQQTAQNLERYGSIAGANGVSGGARASLMGKALQEANYNRGQLERQLVLDNIAAKDRAAQAYGGALAGATATGIDINKYNAGAADRDTGLRLDMPLQFMNIMDGVKAGDKADAANADATQLIKDFISGKGGGSSSGAGQAAGSGTPTTPANTKAFDDQLSSIGASVGEKVKTDYDITAVAQEVAHAKEALVDKIRTLYPDDAPSVQNTKFLEAWREWLWNAGLINGQGEPRTKWSNLMWRNEAPFSE